MPSDANLSSVRDRAARRWAVGWAAGLIFLTAGYFVNTRPGWNVNSSFALACALGERGTFAIDAYHMRLDFYTGDKALHGGHVYSDKSPVIAILGAPVVFCCRHLSSALNLRFSFELTRWLTTWFVVGGSAALLAGLLASALMRRCVAPMRAALASVLWIAATPLLGYTTLFFNYVPACAMAFGGILLVENSWRRGERPASAKLLAGGFLLGLAVWTLNTMALAALLWTIALTLGVAPRSESNARTTRGAPGVLRAWAGLWPWAIGGILGICGYFIYVRAIFGSFGSPYAYEADPFFREQMARGFMGATQPRALVAWLVTFHPFLGLFRWFPLTLAALGGLPWMMARGSRGERIESAAAISIFVALLLYNSAYYMWWGGWAYAPRHLIPALPFLALGMTPWLAGRRRWPGRFLLALGFFGAVLNVCAVAVDPQVLPMLSQEALMAPERVAHWPSLGQRILWQFRHQGLDHNWGKALDLPGFSSLIPLLALWILAWVWLAWRSRPRNAESDTPHQTSTTTETERELRP